MEKGLRLQAMASRFLHLGAAEVEVIANTLSQAGLCTKAAFLRALREAQEEAEPAGDPEQKNGKDRPQHTATFPGLMDLVLHEDGSSALAVLKSDGSVIEIHKEWGGLDERPLKPTPIEATPFGLLPGEMIAGPVEVDMEALCQDVEGVLRDAAVLPSDEHYKLLTAWVVATYVAEDTQYFPGVLLLGPL